MTYGNRQPEQGIETGSFNDNTRIFYEIRMHYISNKLTDVSFH